VIPNIIHTALRTIIVAVSKDAGEKGKPLLHKAQSITGSRKSRLLEDMWGDARLERLVSNISEREREKSFRWSAPRLERTHY
jgi:hypothetical protein